ncbi:MAG: DUF11 domain-containing protein, partial [Thermoanaerobaculia bacterium]
SNYGGDSSGGAISLRESESGTLARLVLVGNVAGGPGIGGAATGGAVEISGGRLRELRDSLFDSNLAQAGWLGLPDLRNGRGGGLANRGAIDSIARTTFSNNRALGFNLSEGRGGGLDNGGRIGAIVSATFAGNEARGGFDAVFQNGGDSFGGGLANVERIERIDASTFVGNRCPQSEPTALFQGGGIYTSPNFGTWFEVQPATILSSSLLAGNEADDGEHDCYATVPFASGGHNLAMAADGSCHLNTASDLVGVDPLVEPLADYGCTIPLPGGSCLPTVALPATSAALDAGLCDAAGSEIDARGALRPLDLPGVPNAAGGDECDIGAFERDASLPTVHVALAIAESADPAYGGLGADNLVYTVALASLGSQDATGVEVALTPLLPAGVTVDSVAPSTGAWNGTTWSLAALASGDDATITFTLTAGLATAGGEDVVALSAVVTAAAGHTDEFAADVEKTTVVEGIFVDGFESNDTALWSQTVPGG